MMLLVGLSADDGGREALGLAAAMTQASGGRMVVCTIAAEGWTTPSPARVDYEYARFLREHADRTQETARALLPVGLEAEFVTRTAPSAAKGLLATAGDVGADYVVLGSAASAPPGRFAEGPTATEVLHGASVPVALAPRGGLAPGVALRRVSCAVPATEAAHSIAERAGVVAAALSLPLRVLTFVTRANQMYPTGAGYHAEHLVSGELRRHAEALHAAIRERWTSPVPLETRIGRGAGWQEALDDVGWEETELLVIGSSVYGPLLKVFIGSNSGRLVRLAPVPRVVLPRWIA
ncbi:hypothetical protein CG51_02185 [Haematobacter missouriensis]|uniref:Universal stress protein n=1 Tax=Haematobacter missouriensis TaxID=366616 RepID=A0A212AMW3_9RHOB|nr:universal stress protein [Haematobacter missouriensis]KFI32408.1 hypothetical protein CG51_02185 [Haematobacter missouriensis]OWJ71131.1 universal stress protein [Haematobacter missouriensis]OWJ82832.1 universal stress protein [Haematobacter missouriensis]